MAFTEARDICDTLLESLRTSRDADDAVKAIDLLGGLGLFLASVIFQIHDDKKHMQETLDRINVLAKMMLDGFEESGEKAGPSAGTDGVF